MIDFRYHLASIIAIFLALGLGLLVGSTELAPKLARGLQNTSRAQKNQIDSLLNTQRQLRLEINRNQQFAQATEQRMLGGLLAGQRVVIVTAPGAPGQVVNGISQLLTTYAGATVTGQVQLQPGLFDPGSATQQELATLAAEVAPPGTALVQGTAIQQAGQVLAGAILTRDGPGQPLSGQRDSASTTVLNGFAARGFVTVGHPLAGRATLALVVIPDSPPGQSDSNPASQALVTLAQQFQRAGLGTVVAGSTAGSGPGSAIDVMRTQGRSGKMTSVDGADTTVMQIVAVQALYQQLTGASGSYGLAASAGGAGPTPAPSPSPSGTAATTAGSAATPGPAGTGKP